MRLVALILLAGWSISSAFGAEGYPAKPVRVIVPFAAGGTADSIARVMSQQLSDQLGQPFVVENRTGAGGTIGNAFVAKAAPDGYTLMLMDTSTTMAPGSYKTLPFDVEKDFTPISQILGAPMVLVVRPSLNTPTLRDFITLAQANPGKLNFGSGGVGGVIHVPSELFLRAANVNVAHIPYKGGSEAMAALLGGQIDMLVAGIPTVLEHVKSGRLLALATTTSGRRAPLMPDVPSMSEAGVQGMAVYTWYGFAGPAGLPGDVVRRLRAEIVRAVAIPAVRDRFVAQSSEIVASAPEEFARHVRSEVRRWTDIIRAAGIPPQ